METDRTTGSDSKAFCAGRDGSGGNHHNITITQRLEFRNLPAQLLGSSATNVSVALVVIPNTGGDTMVGAPQVLVQTWPVVSANTCVVNVSLPSGAAAFVVVGREAQRVAHNFAIAPL